MIRSSSSARRLEASGFSSRGLVRRSNADEFLIVDLAHPNDSLRVAHCETRPACSDSVGRGQLLLVADGIGTGIGGGEASRILVDVASRVLAETRGGLAATRRRTAQDDTTTLRLLVDAMRESQREMDAFSERSQAAAVGTTVTMACILGSTLHVLHAGDSRCYLIRQGKIRCLTTDHTLAQQLVDHRCMTPDTARRSRLQHVLWNAITSDSDTFELESVARQLQPGDVLLLCTDGLTKHLTDDEIAAVADDSESSEELARRLVEMANADGGTDNVTVVAARCTAQVEDSIGAAAESLSYVI